MTPATTPKPIFTHNLPDSFFASSSPPAPISPISNLASGLNSPIPSPHIHPAVNKFCSTVDPIDMCVKNLSIQDEVPIIKCVEDASMLDKTSIELDHLNSNEIYTNKPANKEYNYTQHHFSSDYKSHRLSLDDFAILQTVGTGSSARVHLAKSKVNGKYYAIKAISKKDLVTKRQVEHANNERDVLGSVSHPFLVKLWGCFQCESHVFLVMDYVPGGELFRVLRKKKVN